MKLFWKQEKLFCLNKEYTHGIKQDLHELYLENKIVERSKLQQRRWLQNVQRNKPITPSINKFNDNYYELTFF